MSTLYYPNRQMKTVILKYTILMLVSFLLGIGITYVYMNSQLKKTKAITLRIIDNSSTSMAASQTLMNSCSAAYEVVTGCMLNLNTCNMAKATNTLQRLNDTKNQAASKLDQATQDLKNIFHDATAK